MLLKTSFLFCNIIFYVEKMTTFTDVLRRYVCHWEKRPPEKTKKLSRILNVYSEKKKKNLLISQQ